MSLATSPSLPCRNLVYAMLRHISIKVQNRTGYTRRSWIHLLCEHFPRTMQKKSIDSDKNWEIYTSLKFSLWIKVQQQLAEPPVIAPRPTRWCHWVPHVVGKRASAFGVKHQWWPHADNPAPTGGTNISVAHINAHVTITPRFRRRQVDPALQAHIGNRTPGW